MSYKLFWFPTPLSSKAVLRSDAFPTIIGVPDTHPTGRPGQSFEIPDGSLNQQGAQVTTSAPGKVKKIFRGRLLLNDGTITGMWTPGQTAEMAIDDVILDDEVVCPPPTPCPPGQSCKPDGPPPPTTDPFEIIKQVYATGLYDLKTKEGCGRFTEACCKRLHEEHSPSWGHVKKTGAQNQFNGHAVDAIMLLVGAHETDAGTYDIVFSSESPDAKPAFNRAGDPDPSLWFYPPKPL